eukprot:Blabericola_migrator_1__2260@NODE_1624_length_4146_cov_257_033096_g1033_i1_p3_GENE_NODE_1624_length_4146_cov_257_033096_g1033_i1NODE_1624_length_4146_cov_257_033096_g1033_i1_p3_ORF_typecomplete_len117_score11_48DHO_dh/PF01180_21/0_055_NODE_1624_length_4146_cov_257_033096_g1033_i128083158
MANMSATPMARTNTDRSGPVIYEGRNVFPSAASAARVQALEMISKTRTTGGVNKTKDESNTSWWTVVNRYLRKSVRGRSYVELNVSSPPQSISTALENATWFPSINMKTTKQVHKT